MPQPDSHGSVIGVFPRLSIVHHNCRSPQLSCRQTGVLLPERSLGRCPAGTAGLADGKQSAGIGAECLTWMYLNSMSALSSVCSSWSSLFLSLPERSSLSMNLATSSAGLRTRENLLSAPLSSSQGRK